MPKKATVIDRALFVSSLKAAETNGALPNLKLLQEDAARRYNATRPSDHPEINPQHVYTRLTKDWGSISDEGAIEIDGYILKTKKGRRGQSNSRGTDVDRAELLRAVQKAEESGPCKNHADLFATAADHYNNATGANLKGSTVRTRLLVQGWATVEGDELTFDGYALKTKKGKRGRQPKDGSSSKTPKPPKAPKENKKAPLPPPPKPEVIPQEEEESSLHESDDGSKRPLTRYQKLFLREKARSLGIVDPTDIDLYVREKDEGKSDEQIQPMREALQRRRERQEAFREAEAKRIREKFAKQS